MIAYQLRPALTRSAAFVAVLQGLLSGQDPTWQWRIATIIQPRDFATWREDTAQISRFRLILDRPNPHYYGNHDLERAIEGLRLQVLHLEGVAHDEEGADTSSDIFRQALDHISHGYGAGLFEGRGPDGGVTTWVKVRRALAGVVPRFSVPAWGLEEEEVSTSLLVDAIAQAPAEYTAVDLETLEAEPVK